MSDFEIDTIARLAHLEAQSATIEKKLDQVLVKTEMLVRHDEKFDALEKADHEKRISKVERTLNSISVLAVVISGAVSTLVGWLISIFK